VYPGSHNFLAKMFGQNPANLSRLRKDGTSALNLARDEIKRESLGSTPNTWKKPVHFVGKAGDVVIANYFLAHNIAPNRSHRIRYAVYFRVHSTMFSGGEFWRSFRPVALANPWHDWLGLPGHGCPIREAGQPPSDCCCLESFQVKDERARARLQDTKEMKSMKKNANGNRIDDAVAIRMFPNIPADAIKAVIVGKDGDPDRVIAELLQWNDRPHGAGSV